jgi:hypothetical protein
MRAPLLEIYDFEAHLAGPSQGFRLAQRGRRTGMPQHLAIVVEREIAALGSIDFVHFLGGIRGDSGVQLNLPSLREARELARNLNAP